MGRAIRDLGNARAIQNQMLHQIIIAANKRPYSNQIHRITVSFCMEPIYGIQRSLLGPLLYLCMPSVIYGGISRIFFLVNAAGKNCSMLHPMLYVWDVFH